MKIIYVKGMMVAIVTVLLIISVSTVVHDYSRDPNPINMDPVYKQPTDLPSLYYTNFNVDTYVCEKTSSRETNCTGFIKAEGTTIEVRLHCVKGSCEVAVKPWGVPQTSSAVTPSDMQI